MTVYISPEKTSASKLSVFLAGSITGASNWQKTIIDELAKISLDINIYNPRRLFWDPSWKESINDSNFVQQVNWELDNLEKADIIVYYFEPGTLGPITIGEFGKHHANYEQEHIVCCPEGFWKKGNIDIMSARYDIEVLSSFDEIMPKLLKTVNNIL